MASGPVRTRLSAAPPLLVPVLAGLAYLSAFGAPPAFVLTNAAALVIALVWIGLGPAVDGLTARRLLTLALLTLLFVPLASGPALSGVSRWLPLGPVTLHAGMLAVPSLAVLAARDPDYGAPILLTALFAAFLQPDAATGFALTFAAVALHDVTKDWKIGVTAIIAFFATLVMAMRGELPPQPFVERVFADLLGHAPLAAAALFAALVAGFFLLLWTAPASRAVRYAMAGSLFGFALMALLSYYPTPLVGYGAAPILGFGLAVGLARTKSRL
jgi:hypothetical protein